MVKEGQDLTIGNIGDSRAVLGMRDENNAFVPVMTVDQDELVVLAAAGVHFFGTRSGASCRVQVPYTLECSSSSSECSTYWMEA
ncbi:probable protein phosphatase 2C 6 [Salvia splendens]|uniref:probable protein phosphatase 2C 6 n=1 Tax=Salvia splendens TaxID=180675 RepID=UPI001101021B|nr:probable protein phosphatase 2C 6 [Salvia splendens]